MREERLEGSRSLGDCRAAMDIGPVIMGHPSSATPTSYSLIRLVRGATLLLLTRVTTLHANGGDRRLKTEKEIVRNLRSSIKKIFLSRERFFFTTLPTKKQGKNTI